jgi:hypothetical protein
MDNETNMKNAANLGNVLSALFYSFIGAALLIQHKDISLTTFDRRIISQATIDGVDIGLRTGLYYQAAGLGVIIFLLSFILLHIGFKMITNGLPNLESAATLFHTLSLFGIITLVFYLFGVPARINLLFLLTFQGFIGLLFFIIVVVNHYSWNRIPKLLADWNFLIWLFLQSFVPMFYLAYISKRLDYPDRSLVVYYAIGFFTTLLGSLVVSASLNRSKHWTEKQIIGLLLGCSIPIFISPIFLPLANELYLIFNQKGIFLLSPQKILLILCVLSLIGVIVLYVRNRKKTDFLSESIIGRFYYPIFLIMLVAISYQPPKQVGPPPELFESGNPGIAIDQLFRYGKIPILETFNAHAVSELYAPFLFSVINGYQGWGSFVYNTFLDKLIYVLIAYFFLRKLVSSNLAMLTLVFFPIGILTGQLLPEYYIMALISVIALHRVMKVPSFPNYLLFCFLIFFTFVWRFDIGASAIPAAIITLGLYWILYKKKWDLKNLIVSGIIIGGFWLAAFVLLAFIKDVPLLFRLKELMSVVSSNQIWGYSSLGDADTLNYYLFYFLVPALVIGLIGFLWVRTKVGNHVDPAVFTSLNFLLFFTLFNFPRGLVRHTLVEDTPLFLLGFIAVPIACIPYLGKSARRNLTHYVKFAAIGISFAIIILGIMYGTKMNDQSLFSKTVDRFGTFSDYLTENKKVSRYFEKEEYKNQTYGGLKVLFDQTLDPAETFIDFSNAPMLYLYTNRETPMYINQTPAFLSDELAQSSFLKEIKSYSIPYVVFADERGFPGIDGVPNHIRAYRVAEYIYQNYTPFVELNGFDVWVNKADKIKMEKKLNDLKQTTNVFALYHPNDNPPGNMQNKDIKKMTESTGGLLMETGKIDPQIYGLLDRAGLESIPVVDTSKYELELEYSSREGGNIQVYYLLGDSFTDENSMTVPVQGSMAKDKRNLNLPYLGVLKDIRIDMPNNDTFVLHSLKLIEKTNSFQRMKKSFTETTNVGWVPYFWGEEDSLSAKNSAPVQFGISGKQTLVPGEKKVIPVNQSFDKTHGNYIHLRVKTSTIGTDFPVVFEYGEDGDEISGAYQFNVKADGKYHDYLIRASSQYNWYLKKIQYVTLEAPVELQLESIAVMQGD